MRWKETARYTAARMRREGRRVVKDASYLALAVAALASFAALMPSLEYQHVDGVTASHYDLWVSGPITTEDLEELEERDDVSRVAPILTLTVDSVSGPRTSPESAIAAGVVTAMAYDSPADLAAGPYPEEMLLTGTPPGPEEWACDWNVAHRLDLRVGDTISAVAAFPQESVALEGRLAGIYGPSGLMRDSVALPASPELVTAMASLDGEARWSDLFLSCAEPESLATMIASGPDADRLLALPRLDLEMEARGRLLREISPFLRSGATWVALIAFVAIALWQQSVRLGRRRRELAVLSALGMRDRALARLDGIEQAVVLGATSAAGIFLAIRLMEDVNSTYVPDAVVRATIAVVLLTTVTTILVGAWTALHRLRRLSLAEALAGEG